MEENNCPNCGANINPRNAKCNFCGTFLKRKSTEVQPFFFHYINDEISNIGTNSISLSKDKTFSSINEIIDALIKENIEIDKVKSLMIPYNEIHCLKGLENFESLNELDLRENKISEISDKVISFLQKRIYSSYYNNGSSALQCVTKKNADDVSSINFVLLLKGNEISQNLLQKLSLKTIPDEFIKMHKPFWINDLNFLIENTYRLYNGSEHSAKLKRKHSSIQFFFDDAILNYDKYREFGYNQTIKYFLDSPKGMSDSNDNITLITDLNPYLSNLSNFETGNAFAKIGRLASERETDYRYTIYIKKIKYPSYKLYLKEFEHRYDLNFNILKAKFEGTAIKSKRKWWQI